MPLAIVRQMLIVSILLIAHQVLSQSVSCVCVLVYMGKNGETSTQLVPINLLKPLWGKPAANGTASQNLVGVLSFVHGIENLKLNKIIGSSINKHFPCVSYKTYKIFGTNRQCLW